MKGATVFTIKTRPVYQVRYLNKRGAGCVQSTPDKSKIGPRLDQLTKQRIAATAYEIVGLQEREIGQSLKQFGRWTWYCEV